MESDRYITICSKHSIPHSTSPAMDTKPSTPPLTSPNNFKNETILLDIQHRTTQTVPISQIDAALTHPTESLIAIRCMLLTFPIL